MTTFTQSIRILLIIPTIFLALSARAGGIQLLEGTYAPPVELLAGTKTPAQISP